METIGLIAVVGALNVVCFFIGAKTSQTVKSGETLEPPKIPTPMALYHEKKEKEAAEKERRKLETIMENIENYDGTGYGQKDVPGGA